MQSNLLIHFQRSDRIHTVFRFVSTYEDKEWVLLTTTSSSQSTPTPPSPFPRSSRRSSARQRTTLGDTCAVLKTMRKRLERREEDGRICVPVHKIDDQ
jgi:hypothetical protein